MKRICVFCGSNAGVQPEYTIAARQLGRILAKKKIGLVFGGGSVGLMGEIANAVLQEGGEVIGVIPQSLLERELAHEGLADLRIVGSMHERKALMSDLSDGFIALPGGIGTIEEFFEVLTWAQLGIHRKPCGLLNIGQYYRHLVDFLEYAVSEGFFKEQHRALMLVEESPEVLLQRFEEYRPHRVRKWIDRKST